MISTVIDQSLGLEFPIFQGGMAWRDWPVLVPVLLSCLKHQDFLIFQK